MDNLDKMDTFLKTYNFPKLDQEEPGNLNKLTTTNKIEAVIKDLPTNKNLGPEGFTVEFYHTFGGELTPLLLKLFHKIQEE